MRKTLSLFICALLLVSALFSSAVLAAEVYESESNNDFSTANTIAVGNTLNGRISSATDTDMFKVQLSSKLNANILLSNIPSGCDYDLYLYDSNKNQIGVSKKGSTSNENISTALTPGTYYIKVISYAGSSSSYYKLSITAGSTSPTPTPTPTPTTPPVHGGDMYEFNDTFSLATDMFESGFTISEANIHPLGDVDYFKFNVSTNVSALITIAAPSGLSYRFAIYNSSYGYVTSGGGTSELRVNLTPGTYYIKVYSTDSESVLPYRLNMTTTP